MRFAKTVSDDSSPSMPCDVEIISQLHLRLRGYPSSGTNRHPQSPADIPAGHHLYPPWRPTSGCTSPPCTCKSCSSINHPLQRCLQYFPVGELLDPLVRFSRPSWMGLETVRDVDTRSPPSFLVPWVPGVLAAALSAAAALALGVAPVSGVLHVPTPLLHASSC